MYIEKVTSTLGHKWCIHITPLLKAQGPSQKRFLKVKGCKSDKLNWTSNAVFLDMTELIHEITLLPEQVLHMIKPLNTLAWKWKASYTSIPNRVAMDNWWFLGEDESALKKVPLVYQPWSSGGWFHTQKCMDSTNWSFLITE